MFLKERDGKCWSINDIAILGAHGEDVFKVLIFFLFCELSLYDFLYNVCVAYEVVKRALDPLYLRLQRVFRLVCLLKVEPIP